MPSTPNRHTSLISYKHNESSFKLEKRHHQARDSLGPDVVTLIGVNGSGKSKLLGSMADTYTSNPSIFSDATGGATPKYMSSIATMVHDRFPFQSSVDNNYRYLGLRGSSNALFAGSMERVIANCILELLVGEHGTSKLEEPLRIAGVQMPQLEVKIAERKRRTGPDAGISERTKRTLGVAINDARGSTLNSLIRALRDTIPRHSARMTTGNDSGGELRGDLVQWAFTVNKICSEFGIPFWAAMEVVRDQYSFSIYTSFYDDAKPSSQKNNDALSAGQASFLSLFTRLLVAASPGSVVLIDEPEIGLHPEWQSLLVPTMRKVIPDSRDVQVFLATHSPYLVSDSDSVLVPGGAGAFAPLPFEHIGLSIDETLYYAFGSRLIGSSLIERDLNTVLSWLSSSNENPPPNTVQTAEWALSRAGESHSSVLRSVLSEYRERVATVAASAETDR